MNNKYSVACITLVRDKYTVRLHGAPCSTLDGVTACVVYTAYSIRDSIRTQKNDWQVPTQLQRQHQQFCWKGEHSFWEAFQYANGSTLTALASLGTNHQTPWQHFRSNWGVRLLGLWPTLSQKKQTATVILQLIYLLTVVYCFLLPAWSYSIVSSFISLVSHFV